MVAKTASVRDLAFELPVEERGQLAEELMDSIRTAEELEVDRAWAIEIRRRLAEIEAGTAKLIPAEQVFAELKAKYAPRRRRSR
jgi:putative addiction module component (TIGR02574 family)